MRRNVTLLLFVSPVFVSSRFVRAKEKKRWTASGGMRAVALLALIILCLASISAFGQCGTSWKGPSSGGVWSQASDWTAGVPTASTNVCIDNGNPQHSAVILDIAGAQAANLTIDSNDGLSFNNGTSLTIHGNSIANVGNLTLNSVGSITELVVAGPNVTLSGGGSLTLSNNANNYIFGAATADTLTNQETISGAGHIGNGQMTLMNSGTINANQSAGMIIQANGTGTANSGTIEATAGATLELLGMTVANTGGTISANGSILQLINTTVNGGTLTLTGASRLQLTNGIVHTGSTLNNSSTGTIEAVAGSNTLGGTVNNPTGGVLKIDNGAVLNLENGTYSKLGTVTLNSIGSFTELVVAGPNVTLSGGTVTMSNNANNYIFGAATADTLTNQETISGAGHIGNGQMTLVNSGTINANQSAGMIIQASGGLTNTGTLQVAAGDTMHVFGGKFTNFSGSTLTGGSYVVAGTLEIDQLGTTGGEIVTDAAKITLNGNSAKFVDAAGKDVTTNLSTITSAGGFTLAGGRNFTTVGNFTNNGALTIGSGSKFDVNGNLTNFAGTTLTGGTYNVTGTLQFNNANIVTNAANITLSGATSQIVNQTGANGLANFATNAVASSFALAGSRNFTTASNFTNNGSLTVGTGSKFDVNGNLTNFSGSTLTGGTYNVSGTLQFNNANIVTNAANITLTGTTSQIINQTAGNGLANFATNAAAGSFALAGNRSFTTAGNFGNAGTVKVSKGSTLTVASTHNYTQTAGTTTDDGTMAVSSGGAFAFNGGSVFGNGGTFTGNVTSGGAFNIGDAVKTAGKLAITGTYAQTLAGSLNVDIGGLTPGTLFDQLNVSGAASLGGTLNLDLINGFTPTLGSTFDIMNFASETGTFATITGTHINSGEHFSVIVNPTNVTLDVLAGPILPASASSSPGASPTPEPGTFLLLGTGLLGIACGVHRRWQK